MGVETEISWADATLNVWTGCTKISPACDGCYAEFLMDTRRHVVTWGPHGARHRFKGWWAMLRKIERLAKARVEAGGEPYFVFCMSLGDVFDKQAPIEWLTELLDACAEAEHCILLFLTKRPQIAKRRVNEAGFETVPANVAIGCTVEDVPRARANLPWLCNPGGVVDLCPAFMFVSCEPLLEDISPVLEIYLGRPIHNETGFGWVSWVLAGGETAQGAHRARETPDGAFARLRDICRKWGAVFHMKQMTQRRPIPADLDIKGFPPRVPYVEKRAGR